MVSAPASYAVSCVCGHPLRGERQSRHQIVACPECGRGVFVLPRSPFDAPAKAPRSQSPLRRWRGPLIAAALCLVAIAVSFAFALPYLSRGKAAGKVDPKVPADSTATVERARQSLSQGRFRVARQQFDEAIRLGASGRDVARLSRQAELLALLSPRSLEEIARQAMLVRDSDEWKHQFDDYDGRSFVFDDAIRRDAEGEPQFLRHAVEAAGEKVRVALGDLSVLRDLPLDDGPRLVFGARLARVSREDGGGWVARFRPDSGVLMTDLAAVEACSPTPADPDLKATLERQARWLDERAGAAPTDRQEK